MCSARAGSLLGWVITNGTHVSDQRQLDGGIMLAPDARLKGSVLVLPAERQRLGAWCPTGCKHTIPGGYADLHPFVGMVGGERHR